MRDHPSFATRDVMRESMLTGSPKKAVVFPTSYNETRMPILFDGVMKPLLSSMFAMKQSNFLPLVVAFLILSALQNLTFIICEIQLTSYLVCKSSRRSSLVAMMVGIFYRNWSTTSVSSPKCTKSNIICLERYFFVHGEVGVEPLWDLTIIALSNDPVTINN